jgi:hypothetical protein
MTTFTLTKAMKMIRTIQVLFVLALIAGYAYVSNQDYNDQIMAEAAYK